MCCKNAFLEGHVNVGMCVMIIHIGNILQLAI